MGDVSLCSRTFIALSPLKDVFCDLSTELCLGEVDVEEHRRDDVLRRNGCINIIGTCPKDRPPLEIYVPF